MDIKDKKQVEHHIEHLEEMIGEGHYCYVETVKSLKNILEKDIKEEFEMEKKDMFEILEEGLMTQFEELGKEIGVDENSANVVRARLETVNSLIMLEQLKKENECEPIAFGTCEAIKPCEPTFSLENISTDELIDELGKREMDLKDFVGKWSKPLRDLLVTKYNPYTQIIITTENVRMVENIEGISYNPVG